jgi:hypothetical protein
MSLRTVVDIVCYAIIFLAFSYWTGVEASKGNNLGAIYAVCSGIFSLIFVALVFYTLSKDFPSSQVISPRS